MLGSMSGGLILCLSGTRNPVTLDVIYMYITFICLCWKLVQGNMPGCLVLCLFGTRKPITLDVIYLYITFIAFCWELMPAKSLVVWSCVCLVSGIQSCTLHVIYMYKAFISLCWKMVPGNMPGCLVLCLSGTITQLTSWYSLHIHKHISFYVQSFKMQGRPPAALPRHVKRQVEWPAVPR